MTIGLGPSYSLEMGCSSVRWKNNSVPPFLWGFPCGSAGKESACNAGDLGLIPGLGRSPGEGKGYALQYSGLESSMDCGVRGVAKSRTQLRTFTSLSFPWCSGFLDSWTWHFVQLLPTSLPCFLQFLLLPACVGVCGEHLVRPGAQEMLAVTRFDWRGGTCREMCFIICDRCSASIVKHL